MINPLLKVEMSSMYGNIHYRPLCDQSKMLSKLNRKPCEREKAVITPRSLRILKDLGYHIEIVLPEDKE